MNNRLLICRNGLTGCPLKKSYSQMDKAPEIKRAVKYICLHSIVAFHLHMAFMGVTGFMSLPMNGMQ